MALRSEQARVLRRRVLSGLVRNLALFTAGFVLFCVVFQNYAVPVIADEVAESTSVWRTLDSNDEFASIMEEQGFSNRDIFDSVAFEMEQMGYPGGEGTGAECVTEAEALSSLISHYAEDSSEKPSEEDAEVQGNESVSASSGTIIYDTGDIDENSIDDAAAIAFEKVLGLEAPGDNTTPVPMVSYTDILAAYGIALETASAAETFAALRASAAIQEEGLNISLPEGIQADETIILASLALYGFDEAASNDIIADAYRESQARAYDHWAGLSPEEEAQELEVSNENPVWQIIEGYDGTYRIRDIAFYTFVKSFKLPLAAAVFVTGWLLIIFRALNRSFRYFDELSGAVGTVLADKEAPIELPPDLSIARNELTVIQQKSLADERAAQGAEQRKNELVAYLAHDIRTPLTSVLGYLDLLREATDLPRETLRRYADIAYSKAERLESLINEFFEITRYNLSAIPIERETVGVKLFCQQVAESFFPEAAARSIHIAVDTTSCDKFFVDPDKMARALGNVMRNAVAYADPHSTIALTARPEGGNTVITVANRGREISAAHLETIFEKFYREDGARSSKRGGAGLGLAIAREIVVAHEGDISAQSEKGVTVFTLTVPTGNKSDDSRDAGRGSTSALPALPLRYTQRPHASRVIPSSQRTPRSSSRQGEEGNGSIPHAEIRYPRHNSSAQGRYVSARDRKPRRRGLPR